MTEQLDTIINLINVELTLTSNAGEVNILRGINLVIKSGETIGVVGPSGSGKTSMLMVIAGLEKVSGGDITIADHALKTMSEDKLALFRQRHVGIVFQDFHQECPQLLSILFFFIFRSDVATVPSSSPSSFFMLDDVGR